jgi:long-chain fatty acid transport protein
MKRRLLPILAMIPFLAHAGGFQVNLQGTKQTGMGHLGTSFYLGASSAVFNPAMMGFDSSKVNIEAGASFIIGSVAYQNQSTGLVERTDNPVGTPFYLYGTYKINEKFTAGLAVYTPFGNRVDWEDGWTGRYLIEDIALSAIFIQPTVSYQINEKISVGAGLTYVMGNVEINRDLPTPIGNTANVNLQGDANGIGFNAGVYIQATEKLSFGITHRSQVNIELEGGDVDFTVDPALAEAFPDGKFDSELPLPSTTSLGVSYMVSDKLIVSVEGNFVGWDAYESLDFDFEDNTESLEDSENPRNYESQLIIRAGAQYSLKDNLQIRGGVYYDPSPITDEFFNPETPNTDNLGLTLGGSYNINSNFTVDASFLYIYGFERESEYQPSGFGGKYRAMSFIPGIGLNYKF